MATSHRSELDVHVGPYLRPCLVKGEKCLFHTWEHFSQPVSAGVSLGSHTGGQVSYVLGLIEKQDGTMHRVHPEYVKFVDYTYEETWHEYANKAADYNE